MSFPMKKERNFAADQVKNYGFNLWLYAQKLWLTIVWGWHTLAIWNRYYTVKKGIKHKVQAVEL